MPYPNETFLGQFANTLQVVAQELRQYYALVQGYLSAQHKDDGSHAAITADSVTTTGTVVASGTGQSTFAGDVIARLGSGKESGIGALTTVNGTAFEAGEISRDGLLLGGVTNGMWLEQRAFASPFTSGYELRLWNLPWDNATAMLRIGILSSRPTIMDGGTGSTAMDVGASARPVNTVYANAYSGGETGTWTPALSFGGGLTGITYSTQSGTYSKFGNVVTAECSIALTSKGSSTGSAAIGGLPFAANANPAAIVDCVANMVGLTGTPFGTLGSTTVNLVQTAATTRTSLDNTHFSNTSIIRFGITYRV